MKHVAVSRPLVTRAQVETSIEALIGLLDELDGDPDVEANGDELDGSPAEDDFWSHGAVDHGAGCAVSDPDCAVDDVPCDDLDQDLENEDNHFCGSYAVDQTVPEPLLNTNHDRAAMRPHIDRIRRTRCDRIALPGWNGRQHVGYRLRG